MRMDYTTSAELIAIAYADAKRRLEPYYRIRVSVRIPRAAGATRATHRGACLSIAVLDPPTGRIRAGAEVRRRQPRGPGDIPRDTKRLGRLRALLPWVPVVPIYGLDQAKQAGKILHRAVVHARAIRPPGEPTPTGPAAVSPPAQTLDSIKVSTR